MLLRAERRRQHKAWCAVGQVKIFIYLFDCASNGGMTGIIPDTFRRPDTPQTTTELSYDPMSDPPGAIMPAVKAGTALIFDIRTWHAGTPNESDRDRVACSLQ